MGALERPAAFVFAGTFELTEARTQIRRPGAATDALDDEVMVDRLAEPMRKAMEPCVQGVRRVGSQHRPQYAHLFAQHDRRLAPLVRGRNVARGFSRRLGAALDAPRLVMERRPQIVFHPFAPGQPVQPPAFRLEFAPPGPPPT